MTREFLNKVFVVGIVKTRKHAYMYIRENGLRKVVRDDGIVCAVCA